MRLMGIAESGVRAQQLALDTNANNIANVNTPGFKSKRVDFAETLSAQQAGGSGTRDTGAVGAGAEGTAESVKGLAVGSGVTYAGISSDLGQGMLVETGNPLDLAIDGEGYFQVELPDGQIGYTRVGSFRLDQEGRLVNAEGYPLYPQVVVPTEASDLAVGTDGKLRADINGQIKELGQLNLAQFPNEAGLLDNGRGVFLATEGSGTTQVGTAGEGDFGLIRAQSLEQSNVDLATEMTDLVQIQRAYQVNARLIKDGDEMWGIVNSLRR